MTYKLYCWRLTEFDNWEVGIRRFASGTWYSFGPFSLVVRPR